MAFSKTKLVVSTLVLLAAPPAVAQQSQNTTVEQQQEQKVREILAMPWIENGQGAVGGVASIEAGKEAHVLSGDSVGRFIELSGNLPDPGATIVAPKELHWFSIYDYSDVGYVTDKDNIDVDALMKSLRDNQDAANTQRQQQGLDQLTIIDWAVPPHYDPASHNLEWGVKIRQSDGQVLINYTTRHLGRGGYISSTLVSSPETFQGDLAEFRASDDKLAFNQGSTYAEFRNGDKVAGYGLAALIVGGAGAAVVKSGAAKGILAGLIAFWKFIVAGVVAAFAAVAKFFRRIFGRDSEDEVSYEDVSYEGATMEEAPLVGVSQDEAPPAE
jgi:uncharacterized membrane-anchored protein